MNHGPWIHRLCVWTLRRLKAFNICLFRQDYNRHIGLPLFVWSSCHQKRRGFKDLGWHEWQYLLRSCNLLRIWLCSKHLRGEKVLSTVSTTISPTLFPYPPFTYWCLNADFLFCCFLLENLTYSTHRESHTSKHTHYDEAIMNNTSQWLIATCYSISNSTNNISAYLE